MAKTLIRLSAPFLIGFLLVLFVTDAYAQAIPCDVGESVTVDGCEVDCDSLCVSASNFLVSHTRCSYYQGNYNYPHRPIITKCECCR
ncbi:hypothetical protein MKW94_025927 [Papaver nudicaule]|uniref:Uncharacterized protein n=1 Tax=Papaver nudicaule TaxID=74823 RepID=A0AA41UYC0_PAPNU|nr:hypothetical protein [Papaver nudicaule]